MIAPEIYTGLKDQYRESVIAGIHGEKAEYIRHVVCESFEVKMYDLVSTSRSRAHCVPRQILIYLLRYQGDMSTVEIGKIFNRDHSTIVHACQTVEDLRDTDKQYRARLEEFINKVSFEEA